MALQYWSNLEASSYELRATSSDSVKNVNPRNKIIALNNSYHGDTFGAMSVSDRGVFTIAFHDKLFEVIFIDPMPTSTSAKASVDEPDYSQVACFIYEPLLQGAGSMRTYDSEWLEGFLKKCKEHSVICIADEVMTGFGRTGKLFASEYCQTKPDIICLSKGLTGGTMALGVTACTEKIFNAFVSDDKSKTFFHGHSFTANPLACTAALASLDLLQKSECDQQRKMIESRHSNFLTQLTTCLPDRQAHFSLLTKNHRQLGTILSFEIDNGKDGYLNNISSQVTQLALSKGVFLRPLGNTLYIMPPYCISEEQLQKVYDVVEEILEELCT
jgi:adenosylmethionine-8-amino-7-oxononanoate aminotransferase